MLFAKFEAVANAAVLNHLANVQVAIDGRLVPGLFRNPSSMAELGGGMATASPTVVLASGAVMAEPEGSAITVAGVPYVIGASDPDGTGLTTLTLERVQ